MASAFSESWYQVAQLRVGLLPSVRVHKQTYRNQRWYVLQDSCSDKFFRVQPDAYAFLARLTPRRVVADLWAEHCARFPETAPTQDEVIALLGQLHQMNLLFFRSRGESEGIFERYRKNRRKEKLSHLLAFMYLRIPLWDPDPWLRRNIRWARWLFSPLAFVAWCVAVVLGGRAVLQNTGRLGDEIQGLLAVDNLIWLFVSLFILKLLHELGHAIACRRYGAGVHTIGLMFVALMPLPYTDASASWSLRSPWQRSLVAAAGMYVELFVAAVAAIIWANAAPGLVSALAFNLMIIGSVSSLIFNGNPLLKFDSYYILSDLTGLPNLYQRSSRQWLYLAKRYLLGIQRAISPAVDNYERTWYLGYGVASIAYRLMVMVVITLYMADISLFLGVLMILAMGYIWLLGPSIKLVRFLARSHELHRGRARAVGITLMSLCLIGLSLSIWPMPQGLRAAGVLESSQRTSLFADAGGQLIALTVENGVLVEQNQLLMRFRNQQLELERELTGQQLIEVRWLLRQATSQRPRDEESLRERESWLLQRLDEIDERLDALEIRAPHAGIWVGDLDSQRLFTEIARGERLGVVLQPGGKTFIGVVTQEQASNLFGEQLMGGEIRFSGDAGQVFAAQSLEFVPYERTELPSGVLGIPGGGAIPARVDAEGRVMALEPFFEIRARLDGMASNHLPDGLSGTMRIDLEPTPPLEQLVLTVRQLLKARYQL